MIELGSMLVLLAVGMFIILGVCLIVQKGIKTRNYVSSSRYGETVRLLEDKHDLHRFGIGQFLRRQYGEVGSFSLSFNTLGVLVTSLLLFAPIAKNGGLELILILFPIIGIVFVLMSAMLAQFISSQPTAGGLYHVVFRQSGSVLASMVGMLKLIGQIGLIIWYSIGCTYFIAMLLLPHTNILQNNLPFYGVSIVIVLLQIAFNSMKSSYMKLMQAMGLLFQVIGILFLLTCIIMTIYSNSYSAIYIFISDHNVSNLYLNDGKASFAQIGLVIALMSKCFVGAEEASSGAEETFEPRVRTPWSIYLASSYTYIIGFILMLVLANLVMNFSVFGSVNNIGSWLTYLVSESGVWGDLLIIIAVLACWQSGLSSLSHTSRGLLAMARDRILPFSNKLATVSFYRQIPHIAVAVGGLIAIICLAIMGIAAVQHPLESIAILIVMCYVSMYLLVVYFARGQQESSIWNIGKWTPYISWVLIFALLIILAVSIYYVNSYLLIGITGLILIAAIYAYFSIGNVKLSFHIHAQSGRENFELEGRLPLQ